MNDEKAALLRAIETYVQKDPELNATEKSNLVILLKEICLIPRNPLRHLEKSSKIITDSSPHSAQELKTLLQEKNIGIANLTQELLTEDVKTKILDKNTDIKTLITPAHNPNLSDLNPGG